MDSIHQVAYDLLLLLKERNYKILTVESMTGGMIINTLTDIPGFTDNIYGSYTIYNPIAKKEMLNLNTENGIYDEVFARQMCCSCTNNSAEITVAITGHAGAEMDNVGVFNVALLYKKDVDYFKIDSKTISVDISSLKELIEKYKNSTCSDEKLLIDHTIRTFVKSNATIAVLNFVIDFLTSKS